MKMYHVCGLGNALVDVILNVSDAELEKLGLEKGTMRLVEAREQKALLEKFTDRSLSLVSGGSVVNSIIALGQLGGKGACLTSISDDRYGLHYKSEFEALGVDLVNPPTVGEMTGTCAILVTPDAERTMRTCLAVSSKISEQMVQGETLALSEWVFIEGYLFANPELGQGAVRAAVRLAKENGCKIAITFSEPWVVNSFGDSVREAVQQADLVFANEEEAKAYAGQSDVEEAFKWLADRIPGVAVTAGPKGAYLSYGGAQCKVDAFPCTPRDLTGAGDMFAGAMLYGITHGIPLADAGRAACYLAKQVISQVGPRMHAGTREFWDACIAGSV